jgi:TolB protein
MARSFRVSALLLTFALPAAPLYAWQETQGEFCINAITADGSQTSELIVLEDFISGGSADISPDGKKAVLDTWKKGQGAGNAHVIIADLETGEVKDLCPGAMPTWSPEGSLVAFSQYSGGVWIRSVAGTESKQVDPRGWGIQWSPDGRKLAYTVGGQLVIYDVLADKKKEVFGAGGLPYQSIFYNGQWSPDSKKYAVKAAKNNSSFDLAIITVEGDKPDVHVCGSATELMEDYAWHPDGTKLVAPTKQGRLVVFNPAGTEPPYEFPGQPKDRLINGCTWSRDGKTLIFTSTKQ